MRECASFFDFLKIYMAVSAAQRKATDKWQKENYEFIKIRLNKGEKEIIKAKADAEGKSLNEFIRNKIL